MRHRKTATFCCKLRLPIRSRFSVFDMYRFKNRSWPLDYSFHEDRFVNVFDVFYGCWRTRHVNMVNFWSRLVTELVPASDRIKVRY